MVSVIVPVYNTQSFVSECISSIQKQTFSDLEIILIDDGSTDLSGRICDEAAQKDSRIRVVHKENGGISSTRNIGIECARGEWLTFVDSDDTLTEDAVELLIKSATTTRCDIAIGKISKKMVLETTNGRRDQTISIVTPEEAIENVLYQRGFDSCSVAKLFKKSLFESLRFPKGKKFEDLLLLPQIYAKAERIAVIGREIYFYRQHRDSFMSHYSPARLDILEITDWLETWISAEHPTLSKAASDRKFSACFGVLNLLYHERIDLPEVERQCWDVITTRRFSELSDVKVRLKNKIGALVSFGGKQLIELFSL